MTFQSQRYSLLFGPLADTVNGLVKGQIVPSYGDTVWMCPDNSSWPAYLVVRGKENDEIHPLAVNFAVHGFKRPASQQPALFSGGTCHFAFFGQESIAPPYEVDVNLSDGSSETLVFPSSNGWHHLSRTYPFPVFPTSVSGIYFWHSYDPNNLPPEAANTRLQYGFFVEEYLAGI